MKKPSSLSALALRAGFLLVSCLSLAGCVTQGEPAAPAAPRPMHPVAAVASSSTPAPPAPVPPAPELASTETPPDSAPDPALDADLPEWDSAQGDGGANPSELAQRFNAEALREHDRDFRIIRRGNPNYPEVALTFDDGPHPEFLPRLLDKLRELNIHVTFFVVGEKVADAPDMAARIVQDGHEIANHTFHHLNLTTIPVSFVESEIKSNNDMIYQACGVRPRFFRPPGGRADDDVFRIARQEHLTTVMWTDDPADFSNPGPEVIEGRLLKHIRPGAVILLHSGIEQTLAILPDFVAQLRRGGYRFVTMSEMAQHLETNPRVATK